MTAQQAGSALKTAEPQSVMGSVKVESVAAGRTRVSLWLNTPTYLALQVVLESASFTINRDADGGMTLASSDRVTVTGLTTARDIAGAVMLASRDPAVPRSDAANQVTWSGGFKLRIQSNGALEWFCCPGM
jgi:hypothetical protein